MGNDIGDIRAIHKENAECEICHNELWVNIDFSEATVCESCLRKAYANQKNVVDTSVKALYAITRDGGKVIRLVVEINQETTDPNIEYKLGQKIKFVVEE